MSTGARSLAALALLLFASLAQAAFHNFRIEQIYTNADGTVQFVVLHESFGQNNENLWTGQTLRATPAGGLAAQFRVSVEPPVAATRRVAGCWWRHPGFAAQNVVTPDFTMPAGFLPVGGGTLNYAGVHQVTFGPLPTDGVNAINASGTVIPNVATNFAGAVRQRAARPVGRARRRVLPPGTRSLLRHPHRRRDRDPRRGGDDQGLGAHRPVVRTFITAEGADTSPVCRIRIPPEKGDSHFYGRGTMECNDTIAEEPDVRHRGPAILPRDPARRWASARRARFPSIACSTIAPTPTTAT